MNDYQDETILCAWGKREGKECRAEFTFTARDQAFYAEKGFVKPKFCFPHRAERKKQQQGTFKPELRTFTDEHQYAPESED